MHTLWSYEVAPKAAVDFQLYLYGIKAIVVLHHPMFSKQQIFNLL